MATMKHIVYVITIVDIFLKILFHLVNRKLELGIDILKIF